MELKLRYEQQMFAEMTQTVRIAAAKQPATPR
jgi:hypothetical protein